ncbi:MAG: TetR/AcrR family transcriptional regulator [Acidimicrobiales bacterium]
MSTPRALSGPDAPRRQINAHRREQLLDAAAELLAENGRTGFTMEGIATRTGVSKALPYQHFANADQALIELYRREIGWLTRRIAAGMEAAGELDDALRAAVREYFLAVDARGAVLAALAGPGSDVPALVEASQGSAPNYVAELLVRDYGVSPKRSEILAAIVASIVIAASEAVARGLGTRRDAEEVAASSVLAAVHAEQGGAKAARRKARDPKAPGPRAPDHSHSRSTQSLQAP